MSIELRLPQLAETVTTARLGIWLKQEGDTVKAGEPIVEIETDKTNVELEAPVSGVVQKIHVQAGTDGLEAGVLLASIGEYSSDSENQPPSTPKLETPVGIVESNDSDNEKQSSQPTDTTSATSPTPPINPSADSPVAASPLARRMAAAAGLDLATIRGTGRSGRISKADVEKEISERQTSTLAATENKVPREPTAMTIQPTDATVASTSFQEQPLSTMRRVTAVRLQKAKQTVPHFYLKMECTVDAALELRTRINEQSPDLKLTLTDIIVRAAALALRKVPQANSTWTDDAIRIYEAADIAVAVNTPMGLITPIVRQADRKGLGAISQELKSLTERARDGVLQPEEYTGGTFTISNLGMYGVESLYAIVNPPQSCILGIGAAVKRPVVVGNDLAVGTIATCTLSADHRAIDGATGAELLAAFRMFVEEPGLLAL